MSALLRKFQRGKGEQMRKLLAMTIMAAAIGFSAKSDAGRYNIQGAACPVSRDSVINDRYLYTSGGIKHNGTVTGSIIATCNVPQDLGTIAAIGMTYTDSDGATSTAQDVEVNFKRTDKVTGTVTNLKIFNSSSIAGGSTSLTFGSSAFGTPHNMDDVNYSYYIDIDLTRASGTATASIRQVELQF